MNTVRLEIPSQKDLRTQVARIKLTIEKAIDEGKYFAERIPIIFHEQRITTASMIISTNVFATKGVFGGRGRPAAFGVSPSKNEGLYKSF